jgi:hypothetical protein
MRLSLRVVLFGLVAVVAIGALVSTPAAIDKTKVDFENGWCEGAGVSLTIETKNADTRCATNFSGTSWQLLLATGHEVLGTSAYPTGFVCKVNGYPETQDCIDTPRYNEGSWAFFVARPGKTTWQYALTGAATHFSECGSAEAWVFVPPTQSPETSKPKTAPKTFKCD